jgi:hypothetical protein
MAYKDNNIDYIGYETNIDVIVSMKTITAIYIDYETNILLPTMVIPGTRS